MEDQFELSRLQSKGVIRVEKEVDEWLWREEIGFKVTTPSNR